MSKTQIYVMLGVLLLLVLALPFAAKYRGTGHAYTPPVAVEKHTEPTCKQAAEYAKESDLQAGFSETHADATADSFLAMCLSSGRQ